MPSLDELSSSKMSHATEMSNTLLARNEALALFIRLQAIGHRPYMVEEANGFYRVCRCESAG